MNGHVGLSLTDSIPPPPPPPPPPEDLPPPPPPSVAPPPPPPSEDVQHSLAPSPVAKKRKLPKKEPLDLDKILAQKEEADRAAKKIRFIPKAEREALKRAEAERNEKEHETRRRRDEVVSGTRPKPDKQAGSLPFENYIMSLQENKSKQGNNNIRIPTGPRALEKESTVMAAASPSINDKQFAVAKSAAAAMRERYMGPELNQSSFSANKKRRRTKGKFRFDWSDEEDTTADYDPLYQTAKPLHHFGQFHRAGVEDDQEADEIAWNYAKAVAERHKEDGAERAQKIWEAHKASQAASGRHTLGLHWSKKDLSQMRERDWRIFKEDFNISTKGSSMPNPMRSWSESNLPKKLLDVVEMVGYTDPSPIQRAAIPVALQNRDLIGVAVTGSGKTAAFLLPLLVYISELPKLDDLTKNNGPYAIILAPTRELAQQIEIEARKFATPLGFTCVSIVGGHSIEEQAYKLREGAEIIIATPGRLVDCIERRVLVLEQCCYVIMDEADRMIDMGFEEPVNLILSALPVSNEKPDTDAAEDSRLMAQHFSLPGSGAITDRYRQTMMYTATMPSAVERIAKKYLRRPAVVTIGNAGEAVETVEQRVEFVAGEDRRKKRLRELLNMRDVFPAPIIVFVNVKRNCDSVARDVRHWGLGAVSLHGGKTQVQREAALAQLRNGDIGVLVATDLAGRGIDVPDVSLVVNFNMAGSIESYTHRIGRTGRAGKSGVAITFLGQEDADVMYDLKQMLMKSSISKVPEELRRHEAAQQKRVPGQSRGKKEEQG